MVTSSSGDGFDAPSVASNADLTGYIAEICGELMEMASASHLDLLAYLLGMARFEADQLARSPKPARTGPSAQIRA